MEGSVCKSIKMSLPKIYVIILNYNSWMDTIECLESVLRSDYPNYQVIVVDNNSSDNSLEYLKMWAEGKLNIFINNDNPLKNLSFPPLSKPIPYVCYTKEEAEKGGNRELENKLKDKIPEGITTKYPIIFIQSGDNLGFATGNNVGIRYALAKNDFDSIILLNNDTVIKKDAISILMNTKLKFGDEGIYGGRIFYYSDPKKIWYDGGKFNEWTGRTIHLNLGKYIYELKNVPVVKEVNFITFCYVLIPKFILNKIGLLDESYFMYVEDLDYSYNVWRSGYKLYNVSISEIWHKVGTSSGGEFSYFSAYHSMKNRVKFLLKNKILFGFIFLIFSRIVTFAIYLKQGRVYLLKAQIRGFLDGINDILHQIKIKHKIKQLRQTIFK